MKNMTKGQKFFLLLIISVICVFAFCMAGCHTSCFGCNLGFNAKNGTVNTGVMNSCSNCGSTSSCGAGAAADINDAGIGLGIRFLADSVKDKGTSNIGSITFTEEDINALYGDASCYILFDECGGCEAGCGIFNDDLGASESYISFMDGEFDTGCGEKSNSGIYRLIKFWFKELFK